VLLPPVGVANRGLVCEESYPMSIVQDRMSDKIRAILSELLLREVSDPRLHNVTVTEVRLDTELTYANVYVNGLGDESRQKEVMQGLKSAQGFLRREVGKRVKLRNTPELNFHWDTTLERGERIGQLLDSLAPQPRQTPPTDE
jgi:ribosome-binding factor A